MRTARFLPNHPKRVGAAVVVLLLANAAAWYQLEIRADRAPSFDRGGSFLTVGGAASAPSRPATTTTVAPTSTEAPTTEAPTTTAAPAAPAPPPPDVPGSYAPAQITAVAAPNPAPRAGVLPALGTYEWKVTGTEGATGFGTRTLPPSMTLVAHPGEGPDAGHVVLDTNYSRDHQERLIVADQGGALVATYEGGQVRFGPMAQTNAGAYTPPMTYLPADLKPGAVSRGTTEVKDGGGKVQRAEDWTVTVVGQTSIPVAGVQTVVWEVLLERKSKPGSPQEVVRTRRQWWDPNRRSVVKYHDTMHGQQRMGGVTFTFDSDITAELVKYTAP